MQPRFIDLHTHTTASDGSDSPTALVRKAAALRLAAVAITDHDTLAGLEEAEAAGKETSLEVIRGCELGVESVYGEVHLVGLWIPQQCEALQQTLETLRRHRATRNQLIVEKLQEQGVAVSYDEVLSEACGESIGRPHIAAVLFRKGYVGSITEAFTRFLGEKASAYVPRKLLKPEEGVRLLADTGAVVSLAHPMLIHCPAAWFDELIPCLKASGLQAIEAYHSEHSARDERFCVALAARYGLALTGGSDYHGTAKPGVALGKGKGGLRVTTGFLDALKARFPQQTSEKVSSLLSSPLLPS